MYYIRNFNRKCSKSIVVINLSYLLHTYALYRYLNDINIFLKNRFRDQKKYKRNKKYKKVLIKVYLSSYNLIFDCTKKMKKCYKDRALFISLHLMQIQIRHNSINKP